MNYHKHSFASVCFSEAPDVCTLMNRKKETEKKRKDQYRISLENEALHILEQMPVLIKNHRVRFPGSKYITVTTNINHRNDFIKILRKTLRNAGFLPVILYNGAPPDHFEHERYMGVKDPGYNGKTAQDCVIL